MDTVEDVIHYGKALAEESVTNRFPLQQCFHNHNYVDDNDSDYDLRLQPRRR